MTELGHIRPLQVWALIPVKSPISAKTRLGRVLSLAERARLQWAMLQDVLDQLTAARWLTGVAIVCPDAGIQALARSRGLRVFGDEPSGGGMNGAVRHGARRLRRQGADLVVVLPGDVPMLNAADIDRAILCAVQHHAPVVVPDHEGEGTNALVFWTDRMPRFAFGKASFRTHLGDATDHRAIALPLRSIARDIDWPDDLDALYRLAGQGTAPRTHNALASCSYARTPTLAEEDR